MEMKNKTAGIHPAGRKDTFQAKSSPRLQGNMHTARSLLMISAHQGEKDIGQPAEKPGKRLSAFMPCFSLKRAIP